MKTVLNTSIAKAGIVSAALIAPLVFAAPAHANMASPSGTIVNQAAVEQLTTGLKDTLAAYDALNTGNISTARTNLDSALRKMESALAKDATLGVAQTSAKTLHSDLKRVRTQMSNSDQFAVKSELQDVLSRAGVSVSS